MFNNLSPEEVNLLVRNNDYFKLPKEVVFYSNRENLADCSLESTKHNEGWLFKTKDASFYYDPHRESLKLDVGNGLAFGLPYKVPLGALSSVITYKVSITEFGGRPRLMVSELSTRFNSHNSNKLIVYLVKTRF